MGRRTVLLVAAVVVAALGVTLVFLYVSGIQRRANNDAQLVKVLVASKLVSPGTTAADAQSSGAFVQKEIPSGFFPDGGLSTVEPISSEVALAPIYPGQQVLAQMFGQPSQTSALSIPKGELAVAVQLGDPNRVAGFVVPGSQVAVFATMRGTGDEKTQLLLDRVSVIGVGPTTTTTTTTQDQSGSTTEEIPNAILTLALKQSQAQKIIFAQSQGELYFGLLSPDSRLGSLAATTSGNLFR
jgi:pilus assembly protein CpaB